MPIKEIAKVFCHNRRVSADFQRELQSFGFSWGSLIDEMPWGTDNKYLILIYSYEGKRIIMRMTEADWNECNAVSILAADELGNNMIKLKSLLATIKPNIDTPAPLIDETDGPALSITMTEKERQLLVLALKVMVNTIPYNSTYAELSGTMSRETLIQDVATASVLRYKLKQLGNK